MKFKCKTTYRLYKQGLPLSSLDGDHKPFTLWDRVAIYNEH